MKLKTLLVIGLFAFLNAKSQTYTTGTVPLFSSPAAVNLAYSAKIDVTSSLVTVTLIGPSTGWLGLAFDATSMDDIGKDVIIFDGTSVTDRTFDGVGVQPPLDATQNWTLTSNTVASGVRTVVATRALNTADANDYTFVYPPSSSLNIAYARKVANFTVNYHGANSCGTTSVSFSGLGVNDASAESKNVQLYPNPVKDVLSFTNVDKIKSVRIFDATGKQLPTQKSVSNLNVSTLGKGVYFVEVEKLDGTVAYEKFIKN